MSKAEVFRVALTAGPYRVSSNRFKNHCELAERRIAWLLRGLNLGKRLTFDVEAQPAGKTWLIASIEKSLQLSLLAGAEDVQIVTDEATRELDAAGLLAKRAIANLKELKASGQLSGYQLEEMWLRDRDQFHFMRDLSAFLPGGASGIAVQFAKDASEDFLLTPHPTYQLFPTRHEISFRVKMVGKKEAHVDLEQATKAALNLATSHATLIWERHSLNDHRNSELLFSAVRDNATLTGFAYVMLKSSGSLGKLTLHSIHSSNARTSIDRLGDLNLARSDLRNLATKDEERASNDATPYSRLRP